MATQDSIITTMDTSEEFFRPSLVPDDTWDRIIFGLDYGTTGTGASFILVEGKTGAIRVRPITWRENNTSQWKVASRIAYARDNPPFSMSSSCWGFEIHPDMKACSWTKLRLDSNAELAKFDDEALRKVASQGISHTTSGKEPVDVVADYLQHVLNYAWRIIRQELGVPLNRFAIDLQFTVPATWSQKARELSERAVTRAWCDKRPQDTLTLMSEPEAAAEVVHEMLRPELKVGDGILICDSGGGTVDIGTYLVMDCDRFSLSEITSVQGGKCGGTAIDSRLYEHMEKRLSSAFRYLNYLIAPGSECMNAFEDIKKVFGSAEGRDNFRLPLNLRRGLRDCTLPYYDPQEKELILSKEDIQHLFDPVISKIISLVNSQIIAAAKECGFPVINKIVLVGGLASSPYVQTALRQCFEIPGTLSVTVPEGLDPILAVAAGSALCGLRRLMLTSPQHYGLGPSQPLVQALGPPCMNTVAVWVITMGYQYQQGYTRHQNFSTFYEEGDIKMMRIPVYSCGLRFPPSTDNPDSVVHVGYIITDFSSLDLKSLVHEIVHDKTVYTLDYSVKTVLNTGNGTLHFTAEALGETIGTFSLRMRGLQ